MPSITLYIWKFRFLQIRFMDYVHLDRLLACIRIGDKHTLGYVISLHSFPFPSLVRVQLICIVCTLNETFHFLAYGIHRQSTNIDQTPTLALAHSSTGISRRNEVDTHSKKRLNMDNINS